MVEIALGAHGAMFLRATNSVEVWRGTAIITAIAVGAPVLVVGSFMVFAAGAPLRMVSCAIMIAALIPLLIAPPVAYLALSLIRRLNESLVRVDEHVKYDSLTGTYNRSFFLDSVRASRDAGVLMLLDIDHFKAINDTRGHAAGDEALRILGHSLVASVGNDGLVGRMGGEEFGIFLNGMPAGDGLAAANDICSMVRALDMIVEGQLLNMTVSIGVVAHNPAAMIGHALRAADACLYQAKSGGRDRAAECGTCRVEMAHSRVA